MSVNPDPDSRRIFAHFTQATDTENIKRVFNDVREHVLEQNLKDYNLMWNFPFKLTLHAIIVVYAFFYVQRNNYLVQQL